MGQLAVVEVKVGGKPTFLSWAGVVDEFALVVGAVDEAALLVLVECWMCLRSISSCEDMLRESL
jgi:hypothetical protein